MKIEKAFLIILLVFTILILHQKHLENLELKSVQKVSYYNLTDSEKLALQKIAIVEAGNEGPLGMAYVMQVIINRMESDEFPNTIEGVISSPGQFATYSSGAYFNAKSNTMSEIALVMFCNIRNRGQIYFENVNCQNTWMSKARRVCFVYNNHRFYV